MRVSRFALLSMGAALFVAACETGPNAPEAPTGIPGPSLTVDVQDPPVDSDNSIRLEGAKVCKYGTNADFTYDIVDRSGEGGDESGSFSLVADQCVLLVLADGAGADVTVTEVVANLGADEQFDELVVTTQDEGGPLVTTPLAAPSATVTVHGSGGGFTVRAGAVFEFYNSVIPPTGGGEGCTPGYWKNHAGADSFSKGGQKKPSSWEAYDPTDSFNAVFGVTSSFGGTLIEALIRGGGGENALGRHAVAALLNAAHSGVDFDLSTAEVIQIVQDAYTSGDFEGAKDTLVALNEQGCPL